MGSACGVDCERCPAAVRCGRRSNFCLLGSCSDCAAEPLRRMEVRRAVMAYLGGLDLSWPRPVSHHQPAELPLHLPVLVQAYADELDLPWVAIHGGRLLGSQGRVTPKHRGRSLRDVYRLGRRTRVALELYVDDQVLEGVWTRRHLLFKELAQLRFDLILAPNLSVWRDVSRFEMLGQIRRSFLLYHEALEAGLPVLPDVGWSLWEPDGRLWAEWVNAETGLRAVSIFCGGKRIHAERRAHQETVEDIALFHQAVRPEVTFVLGGVHSPRRLLDYRRAAPGRRLTICNGQAYALAQRRRLLDGPSGGARSARDCFLRNCESIAYAYAAVLKEE
ncbi:MAG: DUF4417 domain-containing protein [Candidatus Dormibacteraeota bacterium]|nr:DUF4417 domain-containing protein [Candidatus Dormibacteraeota bacterium]